VTELGWYRGLGTPIKMSRTPGGTRDVPPAFNQHGDEILARHGYTQAEIEDLKTQGIVVSARRA